MINILITIDQIYLKQANVLLNSIQTSNKNEKFDVYVVNKNLTDEDIKFMKTDIKEDRMRIIDTKISESVIDQFPIYEKRYSSEIYYRLFATKFLPKELDRILYLDADTLVINELNTLYNMDFDGNYYIAATHISKLLHKFHEIRLDIDENEPYINTGVLLINLKELRKINVEQKIMDFMQHNKKILMLPDQDIIVAVFGNKIKTVDSLIYNLGDRGLNIYNLNHPTNPIDLKWIRKNTVILHYYGRNKPWNKNYSGILNCFYNKIERNIKGKNKVLILSCGTGGGHNTAAKAIQEQLISLGIEADFKEYLEIINTKIKNTVNELYLHSTKNQGKLFKRIYKVGETYQKTRLKSPIYSLNSLSKKKLYYYLRKNGYNYVVTTHLFAAQALTAIKKEHKINFIAIATDYVCIPFWEETKPDFFIIPHQDLIEDFMEKGIKNGKLIPLGIPVRKVFSEDYNKDEYRKKLKIKKEEKCILILTGSMGFGNSEAMVKELSKNIENVTIWIACGTNKKLKESFDKMGNKKIIPIPYTKDIDIYMKSSDVILSKPGGLTTTEIATLRKPLVHTMPIPGCETYNANFFYERGMSLKCENIEEVVKNTKQLLENKEIQKKLMKNQEKYISKESSRKIAEFIIKQIKAGEEDDGAGK